MVTVECEFVRSCSALIFRVNVEGKLCADQVLVGVVLSIGGLGAGQSPIFEICGPACCDSIKDWFNDGQVNARIKLNINIVCIFDSINCFDVFIGY